MTRSTYEVPQGDDPVRCDRCQRPFRHERYLALHRGLEHPEELTAAEEAAVATARSNESDELAKFRLKALGWVVILYFGLLMTYALV